MKHLKNILLLLCLNDIGVNYIHAGDGNSSTNLEISINQSSTRRSDVQSVIKQLNEIELDSHQFEFYLDLPYSELLEDVTKIYEKANVTKIYADSTENKYKLIVFLSLSCDNFGDKFILKLSKLSEEELQKQLDELTGKEKSEYAMIRYAYEAKELVRSLDAEYAKYIEGYGNYKQELFIKVMNRVDDYKRYLQELKEEGKSEEEAKAQALKIFKHHFMTLDGDGGFSANEFNYGLSFIKDYDKQAELDKKLRQRMYKRSSFEGESISTKDIQLAGKKIILDEMEGETQLEKLEFLLNSCVSSQRYIESNEKSTISTHFDELYNDIKDTLFFLEHIGPYSVGCGGGKHIIDKDEFACSTVKKDTLFARIRKRVKGGIRRNADRSVGEEILKGIVDKALRGRKSLVVTTEEIAKAYYGLKTFYEKDEEKINARINEILNSDDKGDPKNDYFNKDHFELALKRKKENKETMTDDKYDFQKTDEYITRYQENYLKRKIAYGQRETELYAFAQEIREEGEALVEGKRASKLIKYEEAVLEEVKMKYDLFGEATRVTQRSYVADLYKEVDRVMNNTCLRERKEELAGAYIYFLMLKEMEEDSEETKDKDIEYIKQIAKADTEALNKTIQTLKSHYLTCYGG